VVCIDVKKKFLLKEQKWIYNGSRPAGFTPDEFALLMEDQGAGEIIIQSIEKDGLMIGYDISLIKKISESVTIPVIALGGAGNLLHLKQAYNNGFASAMAAGSIFVYHGARNGILINYPSKEEIYSLLNISANNDL
jgi:imidazole glycerol-phosphate synthase subunit HisF